MKASSAIWFFLGLAIVCTCVFFVVDRFLTSDQQNVKDAMPKLLSKTKLPESLDTIAVDPIPNNSDLAVKIQPAISKNNDDKLLLITKELEERYSLFSENQAYPTLVSRMEAINARRPYNNISPSDVLSAMEKSTAWESRKQAGVLKHKLSQVELNDGRTFIEFDPIKVETLLPGDTIDIPIDSINQVFKASVDNIKSFDDGNLMWHGTITNAQGGTVTITQSEKITIASVVLPQTDYTLESHGTDGWVVDSAVLFKVDSNETDIIIPESETDPHVHIDEQ